jgi:hypothetical protein
MKTKITIVAILLLLVMLCGYAFALNLGLKPNLGISRRAFTSGEAASAWKIVKGVGNDYCTVGATDTYVTVY